MSDWYYSHQGKQLGPVPVSELERLASNGEFDPEKGLVWKDGMADWLPVASVPELASNFKKQDQRGPRQSEPTPPPPEESNPYATPEVQSADHYPTDGSTLPEIEPGSEPVDIAAILKASFEITKRHIGMLFIIGAIMISITLGVSILMGYIDTLIGYTPKEATDFGISTDNPDLDEAFADALDSGSLLNQIVSSLVGVFLGLGIFRVGLNIIDGRPYTIGSLFSQGALTFRAFLAQVLFGLLFGVGILLFVVPGIYILLRLGQYQFAIVDKHADVLGSFAYSSRITTGTKMPLFGLYIILFLINMLGAIPLFIGLVFTIPFSVVSMSLAYRWMQHGSAAVAPR
ncbi:DUF4339 domain-containing protein [Haloferula rosea]|uniref:DUF4339 domain-containing protein n=1 Tax=Haloferula rosea TaxID=490093 RepID=A0A934REK6_9BACT|nr:DUF4339 domain-containing protein [Haloferula rosea]MBK1828223.1 DUF4339 domain-containing protein [Haloferula rosea]